MKHTQRMRRYAHEYNEHVRTGVLAKLFDKDRGDVVYWYDTLPIIGSDQRPYSVNHENLNLEEYKILLLKKLSDTLEMAGFDVLGMKSQLLQKVAVGR